MAEANYFSGYYATSPGLASVGSYQVSGKPFLTGSVSIAAGAEEVINFPTVTKSITIINRANPDLRIHFAPAAGNPNLVNGVHYATLSEQRDSITMNVKASQIFITNIDGGQAGSYEIFAELTGISVSEMFNLTGSGITA